ncbi:MAG: beta-galactosidase [Planctomycetota bacterium]|nr:beta-galactosidase [Planctomycetota bacterium]
MAPSLSKWARRMKDYGVRFTWLMIPWQAVEPEKGSFRFEKVDTTIDMLIELGVEVGVHIMSRSKWATDGPPQSSETDAVSTPPKDLEEYGKFVSTLAGHLKGRVARYSIEEEAHADGIYFKGTPEQYMAMLAAACKAIHEADPDAIVQDAGLSSAALGLLLADDLFKAGKQAEAVSFVNRWFARYGPARGKGEAFETADLRDVEKLLSDPRAQRVFQWADLLFDNHDAYDVLQLHYFAPWEQIPAVTDWVRGRLKARGADKPIEFWEFGYGWDDVKTYDPEAHARDEVKYLATALGEGALRVLSWQFDDYAARMGHPGLFSSDVPRPAAESFKITAAKLNGTTASERMNLGADVWGYRFERKEGWVFVLWSAKPATITLPCGATRVTVTDIKGRSSFADPKAVDLTISPVFVEK